MIQFNLLPDVKKEYVKAKRTKRLILSASTVISAAAVGVTVMMFIFVHVAQKTHISGLTKDIETRTSEIKSTEDLETILTVQNQLSILPGLHEAKPETSRVFDHLAYVSPQNLQIETIDIDTNLFHMEISGNADTIATINKLVDNLKAVNYAVVGSEIGEELPTYSEVRTDLNGDNTGANFTIGMTYDPAIYSNTQQVVMRLPGAPLVDPAQVDPAQVDPAQGAQ